MHYPQNRMQKTKQKNRWPTTSQVCIDTVLSIPWGHEKVDVLFYYLNVLLCTITTKKYYLI